MFRDAKVGDTVWSIDHGWGTIYELRNAQRGLIVNFDSCRNEYYYDGRKYNGAINPSIFWDEVKIVPPPKPKKKVKKVIEGWVSLFSPPMNVCDGVTRGCTHVFGTKESMDKHRRGNYQPDNRFLGDPIFIRHEYEVEE